MPKISPQHDSVTLEKTKESTRPEEPPLYNVVLLNDDYTPFDFVIELLMEVFKKSLEEAELLAIAIHHQNRGVCGTFARDIAELKQQKVQEKAALEEHPLQCVIEPASPSPGGPSGRGPRF